MDRFFFQKETAEVWINDVLAGAVQDWEVHCTAQCEPVRGFGDNEASAVFRSQKRYEVALRRLRPMATALSGTIDLYALQNFTLKLVLPDRTVCFGGCEWSELLEKAQAGESVFEQLKLLAATRTTQEVQ